MKTVNIEMNVELAKLIIKSIDDDLTGHKNRLVTFVESENKEYTDSTVDAIRELERARRPVARAISKVSNGVW